MSDSTTSDASSARTTKGRVMPHPGISTGSPTRKNRWSDVQLELIASTFGDPKLQGAAPAEIRHEIQEKMRKNPVEHGLCRYCRTEPIGYDGTATACGECRKKKFSKGNSYQAKKKSKTNKRQRNRKSKDSHNLLLWPRAGSINHLIPSIPEGKNIIDLFGGSGSFCALVQKRKPKSVVYNDLNPWLVAFMRAMQTHTIPVMEDAVEVMRNARPDAIKKIVSSRSMTKWMFSSDWHEIPAQLGAYAILYARLTRGCREKSVTGLPEIIPPLPGNFWRRAGAFKKKIAKVQIRQGDFVSCIREYKNDPDAFFLVDPPFPNDPHFDHKLEGRHSELFEELSRIRGRYLAFSSSNRATMEAVNGIVPSIYWHRGGTYASHVVAANYDVEGALGKKLKHINLERYGYLED